MEHLFWFALPLLLAQAVLGAVPVKIMPSHSHDIWDAAAGFPGGYVYSMTQTGDGYLWIGTSKGLVRYDGLTFVSIRKSDSARRQRSPLLVWSEIRMTSCGPQTTMPTCFGTLLAASRDRCPISASIITERL
jgi:ligand-binding sensor domain-containing protein